MSTPSQLLGKSGRGVTITIDGVEWELTRSTKKIQAAWAKWLSDRAEARAFATADKYRDKAAEVAVELRALNAKYTDADIVTVSAEENAEATAQRDKLARKLRMLEEEARAVIRDYNDRWAGGAFEFYGNVAIEIAQQNMPGQIMLAWLCLLPKHPTVTLEEVERLHMPDSEGVSHFQEWTDSLLRSEGLSKKKNTPSEASTTAQKTTPTTTGESEVAP